MMQIIQQNMTPDPNLQRLLDLNTKTVDWYTGANGVKDIYKHPTLAAHMPVFEMAKQNRDASRVGRGIAGSAASKNVGAYANDLKTEDDLDRSVAASGMLEMGLSGELDKAEGNIQNLVNQQDNRRNAALPALQSQIGRLDQQIASSGWGGFLRGVAGGLASGVSYSKAGGFAI